MTTRNHHDDTRSSAIPVTIATAVVTIVGVVLFVLPTVEWIS
jgi:hypothetical protein